MSRPLLEVDGLEVVYQSDGHPFRAVHDVSFSLGRDEALGLVGESGSGKTTVALAIVRYLAGNGRITAGSIRFDGVDLTRLDERALREIRGRRIAIVYQDPASALNPTIRVGDQVAEVYRRHLGLSAKAARHRVVEILNRVHLADAAEAASRYPHEFSGGQQQRIVIAMALAANPDLLILDEPTTGLDATVEAEILDLFAELRQLVRAAILFISHDIALIARMCERIGVMYAGRFVELGPSEQVLSHPAHPYTRGLLSAMVPVGATKNELRLVPIEGDAAATLTQAFGCSYFPRCPFARERCQSEEPPLVEVGPGRHSRCFFHTDVEVAGVTADSGAGAASLSRAGGAASRARGVTAHSGAGAASVPSSHDVLLEVREIDKVFRTGGRELTAVSGVSFGLRRGKILGIVGESGSGKTTTARIVAGLVAPSGGRVSFAGRDVTKAVERRSRETRRALQMVFQHPDSTLNPRHRVGRILRRTLRKLTPLRGPALERRAEELLAAVRLERRLLDAYPEELSGGQRQRVAIARAFASSPSLVICDEPTSALDVSVQAAVLNLLVDLQKAEGVSYVYISHDLATVRYLADEIAVMYLGEIVEIGPASRVFRPPHHPYTETLLSAVRPLGDGAKDMRIRLRGAIPSPADRPRGCLFHPRCPRKVGPVCEEEPPWQETAEGHRYRCVIPPDELDNLQARRA